MLGFDDSFKELRKSGRSKYNRSPIFKKGFTSSTLRAKERSLSAALQYNNFPENCTSSLIHNNNSQPKSLMNVPSEYAPRLCHLHKLPNFSGYGFNLQSQRLSNLQVIGKVEDGSPAQLAGLQESDIIIEVNGVNVLNENHKQVVARIIDGVIRDGQKFPDEVVLLVVDERSKQWFDNQKISISYNLPNIVFSPAPTPIVDRRKPDQSSGVLNTNNREWRSSLSVIIHPKNIAPLQSKHNSRLYGSSNDVSKYESEKNTPGNGLNLNMTAAEFRELLKKRGKKDPRKNCNLNMEEKYKIIQNM